MLESHYRDIAIKSAGSESQVTFMTSDFNRGTDFIVGDR